MSPNSGRKPLIVIAGAGPGIGEATARRFASEGFVVALLARTEEKLRAMAEGINATFGKHTAHSYVTNLGNEKSINFSFRTLREELGPVKVLVYNAGVRRVRGRFVLDTTSEEFENFTKINLFGAFWSTKCVLWDMLVAGKGTIIYTGATASVRGSAGLVSFSPTKFGLRSLAQVVAREYHSRGIHAVHAIVDSIVDNTLISGVIQRRWQRAGETEKLENADAYLVLPADLANAYWALYSQPRRAWTHELDMRPQGEPMYALL